MRIIRAPRQGHFTIVPNETARDRSLTYKALGLLVELLSHDDGWETSAERLAARAKEGRDSIQTAMKELEQHRYMLRKKQRTAKGRWEWTHFVYDVPQPADEDPDGARLSPVDNPPAPPTPTPVDNPAGPNPSQVIHNPSEVSEQQTSRSEPSGDSPVTDNPSPDGPLTVEPAAVDQSRATRPRKPRPSKEASSKKTITNTPPPDPPQSGSVIPSRVDPVEEGIREVLHKLPAGLLPRSAGQMEAFHEALAPYLTSGWSPEDIIVRAAYEPVPTQVHSPAGFLRQRLANLSVEPPRTRASIDWCGECDESNRWREEETTGRPYKCPNCHPSFAHTPGTSTA